jgi:hypothetical protein
MCIQLALGVSTSEGSVEVKVNGSQVVYENGLRTLTDTPFSVVVLEGLPSPDTLGADIALDELAVGTQPISCN